MRKFVTVATILALSTAGVYAQDPQEPVTLPGELQIQTEAPEATETMSEEERIGYAFGVQIGLMIKGELPAEAKNDALLRGLDDALQDRDLKMNQQEIQMVMMQVQQREQQRMQQAAAENEREGQEFLVENKERDGVTETASGLQYEVVEEGTGEQPGRNDMVTIHYRGTHLDGTEFDSSIGRGEPLTMQAGQFVPGFSEGLTHMKEGGKYKLFIPGNLAYGQQGNPRGGIEPNETLIFEVELLGVEPAPPPQQQPGQMQQLPPGLELE